MYVLVSSTTITWIRTTKLSFQFSFNNRKSLNNPHEDDREMWEDIYFLGYYSVLFYLFLFPPFFPFLFIFGGLGVELAPHNLDNSI